MTEIWILYVHLPYWLKIFPPLKKVSHWNNNYYWIFKDCNSVIQWLNFNFPTEPNKFITREEEEEKLCNCKQGEFVPLSLQVVMLKAKVPPKTRVWYCPGCQKSLKAKNSTMQKGVSSSQHHSLSLHAEVFVLNCILNCIIFMAERFLFKQIQGRECRQCAEILFKKMEKVIWNDNHFPGKQFHSCISRSVPAGGSCSFSSIIALFILGGTRGEKPENNVKQEMLT